MAIIPSFFGEYAEQPVVQAMIDNSLDNLQSQSDWRKYLDLDIPQASLTFEMAIGRSRIEAAASIVDIDAPAPLRGRNVLELYGGKIPSIKEKMVLSQSELRALIALEESQLLNGNGNVTSLISKLYNDVSKVSVSGDKRVDMMLYQGISTLKVDVSTTTNPDGAAYGVIDLLAQPYQKQGVPFAWFTADGNGNFTIPNPNATPIDDIENYLEFIVTQFGRTFGKIMMSQTMWLRFRRMQQVISRIQTFFNVGKANASFAVTLDNVNSYFAANGWPPFEIVNTVVGIEKNGIITPQRPFNEDNVAFVPDGKIGLLKNAFPMERRIQITGKTYADFGPTLVSKWADDDPIREYTAMELNAFPALDIDSIYVLTTMTVQGSFTGGNIPY